MNTVLSKEDEQALRDHYTNLSDIPEATQKRILQGFEKAYKDAEMVRLGF